MCAIITSHKEEECKSGSSTIFLTFQGPPGDDGQNGEQGAQGAPGLPGSVGLPGPKGDSVSGPKCFIMPFYQ